MRRFSGMRGQAGRLERDLRAARPEPRADFLLSLTEHVTDSRPREPRRASRVAFALALTTFMVGTFASFGGLGYAASGAASAAGAVKQVVASHPRTLSSSSAKAQYGPAPAPAPAAQPAQQAAPAQAVQTSQLPFTGISLAVTAALGLALLAAGLILRWREKKQRA
jgi:hypothetical protein